jgi:hypothetical protein
MNDKEAAIYLHKLLKPGDTVYTVLRNVAKSGMSRTLSVFVLGYWPGTRKVRILDVTRAVAKVAGFSIVKNQFELRVHGCGMDAGFEVVYNLGHALWAKGTKKPHGTRNGEPDSAGGYALKHEWL